MVSLILILLAATPAIAGELEITIQKLRAPTGSVAVALYRASEAEGFPDDSTPWKKAREKVTGTGSVTIRWKDVPKGTYALAVYQDENDDGKMDRDAIGVPSEPFGFSQNPRIYFGAPGFSRCSFETAEGVTPVDIQLKTF